MLAEARRIAIAETVRAYLLMAFSFQSRTIKHYTWNRQGRSRSVIHSRSARRYSATMIGDDIGHLVAAILVLIFAVHVFPFWRIVSKMGYPGALVLLAFMP